MKRHILVLICLYGYIITLNSVDAFKNPCEVSSTCKDCLDADGKCKWCADSNYMVEKGNKRRCNYKSILEENGCKDIQISDGQVTITEGVFGSTTQGLPKKVKLKLRPGEIQEFTLSVNPAEKWNDLGTGIRLNDDSPEHLVVKYKVKKDGGCAHSKKENECTGVAINQKVDFTVQVNAIQCPEKWKDGEKFTITVPGFGDVAVEMDYICECACERKGIPSSRVCNGTGSLTYGVCECDMGRFGKHCECGIELQADTKLCIMPNAINKAICSGFGSCVCGKCECDKPNDPSKLIQGKYCQCNNFECERYDGKVCGGPTRGICQCGKCVCKKEYEGDNCGKANCTIGEKKCIKDGVVCSGNGVCDCDHCNCKRGYGGSFCQDCVFCP